MGHRTASIAFRDHVCAHGSDSDSENSNSDSDSDSATGADLVDGEAPPPHKPASRLAWALRDQRLLFIGDSLTKQEWHALYMDLIFENPSLELEVTSRVYECEKAGACWTVLGCRNKDFKHEALRKASGAETERSVWVPAWGCGQVRSFHVAKWNLTVSLLHAYKLLDPINGRSEGGPKYRLLVPELSELVVREAPMVVINMGLHYGAAKPAAFAWLVRYIVGFLESDALSSARPKANVYRLTTPQHFTHGDYIFGKERDAHTVRHWTDIVAEGIVREFPHVYGADYFHSLQDLYAFHPEGDMTHFCLSPLVNAPQWRVLEAIARNTFAD